MIGSLSRPLTKKTSLTRYLQNKPIKTHFSSETEDQIVLSGKDRLLFIFFTAPAMLYVNKSLLVAYQFFQNGFSPDKPLLFQNAPRI